MLRLIVLLAALLPVAAAAAGVAVLAAAVTAEYTLVLRLAIVLVIGADCWRRRIAGAWLYAGALAAIIASTSP